MRTASALHCVAASVGPALLRAVHEFVMHAVRALRFGVEQARFMH